MKSYSLAALIALGFAYASGASAEPVYSASSMRISATADAVEDVLSSAASSISVLEAKAKTATNQTPAAKEPAVVAAFTPLASFLTDFAHGPASGVLQATFLPKDSMPVPAIIDSPAATPEPAGSALVLLGILGAGLLVSRRFRAPQN